MAAVAPIELVVHVGDGKTGTSAIQRMLRSHPEALAKAKTRYLGLMLEEGVAKRHCWQDPVQIQSFHALPRDQAVSELCEVMAEAVEVARADGLARLIWSNESLINRGGATIEALQRLDGVTVRIVVYVRRHDGWARSAFVQWGLKHKTYSGPVRDFAAWCGKRRFHLMPRIAPWRSAFGPALSIRNFDAIEDTARDFCAVVGLDPAAFTSERRNETPSEAELVLRALFNDAIPERALPARFDRAMDAGTIDFDRDLRAWLRGKLPSTADLEAIADDCADDRIALNALLVADGQPGLEAAPLAAGRGPLNQDALVSALCQIVARQALRLDALEQQALGHAPATQQAATLSGAAPSGVAEALAPGLGYFGAQRSDCLQVKLSGEVAGLRLDLAHGPEYLNLRGLECLSNGVVVPPGALGGTATQSSIARDDPRHGPDRLLRMQGIHTAADARSWWEVRFDEVQALDAIRVFNRGDKWCRRARTLRVMAIRPDGRIDCVHDAVGDEALQAARTLAGMPPATEWPADGDAAGAQRVAIVTRIAARIDAGELAPDAVTWQAIAPLLPLWGARQPTDADWTLVAAMLLTQQRSRQGTGLATLAWLLDCRSRLERLTCEINRLAAMGGTGPFMLSRHGLRREGMLRLDPGRHQRHLSAVIDVLESLGDQPMLAYGTLLGAVREAGFLAHDDDVDLLYVAQGDSREDVVATDLPRVAAALERQGFKVDMLLPNNLNMHVTDPASGAVVDVFPCWREDDGMRLHMEAMQVRALDPKIFLPRATVVLDGLKFPAPARPDDFLQARYGDNWRVSDPYFEWLWTLKEDASP